MTVFENLIDSYVGFKIEEEAAHLQQKGVENDGLVAVKSFLDAIKRRNHYKCLAKIPLKDSWWKYISVLGIK